MGQNDLSRRGFLRSAGIASLALGMTSVGAAANSKKRLAKLPGRRPRNVVFILSDDHRYDFMGFKGNKHGPKKVREYIYYGESK